MSQQIICDMCALKQKPMHPEDLAMGWKRRNVRLARTKKPAVHEVKFYSGHNIDDMKHIETKVLDSLMCDHCGEPIPHGAPAVAVTMWHGAEPENWEKDYEA